MTKAVLAAILAVSTQLTLSGQTSSPPVLTVYDCVRATTPPTVDGDLSDACWSVAPWALIGQTQARAKLLWDDVYFYFAAEITDSTPRCEHKDRDSNVWEDDCFEIYLSPDPQSGCCYELDFNSAGAIFDALRFPRLLPGWTAPSLEVRTRPREGGWTIEGRVRLDEFVGANHIPPRHDDRWRVNLFYLNAPVDGGKQTEFAWNPTDQFENVSRFGVLRFVDYEGHAKDQRDRERASWLLHSNRLANAVSPTTFAVSSQASGPYLQTETGWRPKTGYGRVAAFQSEKGEPASWRAQPNSGADPTLIEFVADRDGVLVILGRMLETHVALIEQGSADGVWLSAQVQERSSRIHLHDTNWRAATVDMRKGDKIRLTIEAGPAQNVTGDSAQLAVLLAEPGVLDPGLPEGWKAIDSSADFQSAVSQVSNLHREKDTVGRLEIGDTADWKSALQVIATDHFTGARRELPVAPGTKLYKVTGRVRSELAGTTKGHVGIDFLDHDGKFIRQATTPVPLNDHLRWGLHNFSGTSNWTRFVAYAYDVPANATTLSLWLGVNAWEQPDAAGRAWFADVKVESIQRDDAFPLGFPPLTWTPDKPAPSAKGGYILSRTPITTYQLPTMPPPRLKDDSSLDVLAWPDTVAPVSFSVHALGELGNVRVEVSDLTGTVSIPASRIDVRKVCYLYRKRDLMMNNEYLLSPNHLEPFKTLTVARKQSRQCWLTIRVPANALPGRYQGSVRVVPSRAGAKTMKLTMDVLPIQPRTRPGLLLGLYSYYMKNETPSDLRAMFNDMRAHGMTTTFHFNGGIKIPIERNGDKRVVIRWDQPNRLRELFDAYRDAGFTEPLLLLAPDAIYEAARQFGGDKDFASVYRDLFTQVREEAAKQKWPSFVVAPYDEGYPYPFSDLRFERTRACSPPLRAAGVPIAFHALNHPNDRAFRFARDFENWTDVNLLTFCHAPGVVAPDYRGYDSWTQYRDAMRSKGQRVLFYNPDTTGVHPEAMRFIYGVGLWQSRADGVMDWHYSEHMRGEAYTLEQQQRFAPMDFVFPAADGHAGGPTIGWEAAREGVKDYQLLYTLDQLVTAARQSSDTGLRHQADGASAEVNRFLDRLHFDAFDSTGALTLGRWDDEAVDDRGVKRLSGQFKIPNGFAMEDYDRLRQTLCRWIVELH